MVFVACSSSPQKSNSSGSNSESSGNQTVADVSDMPKKKDMSAEVRPAQALPPVNTSVEKTKDAVSDDLDKAIQAQDNRAIALAARQVLLQSPQDAKALNALALYHYGKGELNTAKALLNKAIAGHDQISVLYSNLGIVLQAMKEDEDAVKAFREALKVDPFNAIAAANVGAYYADMKDYNKAQVALEIAVEKGQRDWRTLNNYGVTLMALGKYSAAESPLKKAVELQSQNTAVLANYAILLIDHLSEPAEGLEVINKIRFIGTSPDIRKKISELEIKAKSLK
jgi:Flp pilus assembly protein TadD